MELNQVYRAPSIPKLSTRNISSSVLRASSSVSSATSAPKLRTSKFSFFKPKVKEDISEKLKESAETTKIYTALAETNQVLVEIQKQLAYDFAMRIAEEKEILKRTKAAESKRKFAAKEKAVEGVRKFGDFAGNIVGKVTAPIKSIFDSIKEFFGLILTGIVTNAAFTWLGNKESEGKLSTIFDWVGKIFVGLLLTVIVGKFIKWGIRFFKLARWLWRLPGRLIKVVKGLFELPGKIKSALGFGSPKPTVPTKKVPWWQKNTKSLSRANESYSRFISGQSNIGDRLRSFRRGLINPTQIFTKGGPEVLAKKPNLLQKGMQAVGGFGEKLKSSLINPIINVVLPKLPPKVKTEIAEAVAKKGFQRFLPYVNVLFGTVEGIQRVLSGDIEGALLSFASAIPFAGWGALALDIYRSVDPEGYKKNIRFGMTSEEMNQAIGEGFNSLGSAMSAGGFSQGGTVPGKGSGFVDSVRAMLAPGEEVIKTTSSMLFRPLLKDINDNAGRLWTLFSQAVLKLIRVSDRQKEVSEEFSKVIKDFDRFVQNEIDKQMISGRPLKDFFNTPSIVAGAPRLQTQSTKASFTRASIPSRSISSSSQSSGGGINFIPMNLPAIQTPPPQIPTPQTTATDVPIISSVNMANPYMQLTPEMYGIFV